MEKVDIKRVKNGMKYVHIRGVCDDGMLKRLEVIEDAIKDFYNGCERLKRNYFGIKNYAHFGDQRCDCEYGYGPRHGYIVFSVGIKEKWQFDVKKIPVSDVIYALEAFRDFGYKDVEFFGDKKRMNLFDVINLYERYLEAVKQLGEFLENAEMENNQG